MKVPPLQFRREDIPDLSTGERTDRLLRGINTFGVAAEKALNKGLTFKDNINAFSKVLTFTSTSFPISIKNELGGTPTMAWVVKAATYTDGPEVPVALGGLAWAVSGNQIVISAIGDVSAGPKYRVTIVVVAE